MIRSQSSTGYAKYHMTEILNLQETHFVALAFYTYRALLGYNVPIEDNCFYASKRKDLIREKVCLVRSNIRFGCVLESFQRILMCILFINVYLFVQYLRSYNSS